MSMSESITTKVIQLAYSCYVTVEWNQICVISVLFLKKSSHYGFTTKISDVHDLLGSAMYDVHSV